VEVGRGDDEVDGVAEYVAIGSFVRSVDPNVGSRDCEAARGVGREGVREEVSHDDEFDSLAGIPYGPIAKPAWTLEETVIEEVRERDSSGTDWREVVPDNEGEPLSLAWSS
jgi:hypothetical protein